MVSALPERSGPARKRTGAGRHQRPPAVGGLAMALAAVPSLRPVAKAWARLGFEVSGVAEFGGCPSFSVTLKEEGVRFLAPPLDPEPSLLAQAVEDRLIAGAGLIGWSWACDDIEESRQNIERLSGRGFATDKDGNKSRVVPWKLNPGAVTVLENTADRQCPEHPNAVTGIDHLVLTVSDADAAARAYASNFGLSPKSKTMEERRYSFLKIGRSVVEIVGPVTPSPGPPNGRPWGLAFRCPDLDRTVSHIRKADVDMPEPHDALQGGRITSLPMHLGGIKIAFMGS
ncbi:MAG: VOC family protein [Deltaproteobacteria bacterium]